MRVLRGGCVADLSRDVLARSFASRHVPAREHHARALPSQLADRHLAEARVPTGDDRDATSDLQ